MAIVEAHHSMKGLNTTGNDLTQYLLASIIICTRNRASYLGNTILKAAAQTLSTGSFEILVVDNGSTDQTPEAVHKCQSIITKVSVRYVVETEVGLSAARNRAIREAKGRILCFLDDDAMPEPEWLEWLMRGYINKPSTMCVGGAVVPIYETELPVWFPEELESIFRPQVHGSTLYQALYPQYPYGANFSIRAEAIRHIGEFNTALGYKDNNLIPCEETEFLLRLEKAGFKVFIEPRAVVNHIIPTNRLTHDYLRRRQYAYGRARAFMDYLHYSSVASKLATINMMIKLTSLVIKNVKLRIRFRTWLVFYGHTIRSSPFLHLCQLSMNLGYSDQELRILIKKLLFKTNFVLGK